jgi:predicted nucleotide-binding protein
MAKKQNRSAITATSGSAEKRKYMSQSDVPAFSLTRAIRVAQAIADNYGKSPTRPLRVAEALNLQPLSSSFRMLAGASIAYGLTDGGYNAETISITPVGKRIVSPKSEGDDLAAKREALLRPRVARDFLTKYNGSRLPTDQIAKNVLEEMGVPNDRLDATYDLIIESAREVEFLRDLKGQTYVDLDGANVSVPAEAIVKDDAFATGAISNGIEKAAIESHTIREAPEKAETNNRVFITHGKNQEIVSQLKELLTFGNLQPIVAKEHETVSKPVPDKVMDEMRSCGAAIIHVGTEQRLIDDKGQEHRILNSNVLIEIGAAMALYGRNFILLVEKDVQLPSNLQGLYEVRYEGTRLDYDATMKLLKAFNDFRK